MTQERPDYTFDVDHRGDNAPEYDEPQRTEPEQEIPRPQAEVAGDGELNPGPEPTEEARRLAEEHAGEFGDIEGETGDGGSH
jgi:hypothetical protein